MAVLLAGARDANQEREIIAFIFSSLRSTMAGSLESLTGSCPGLFKWHLTGKGANCFLFKPSKFHIGGIFGDANWFSSWLEQGVLTRKGRQLVSCATA